MSKTINLTLSERIAALRLFDAFKGSITELSVVLDDVKTLTISKEEWEAAGRQTEKNPEGERWTWNDADIKTFKDITLQSDSLDYLRKTIKERSTRKEILLSDVSLISLQKKLE